MFTQKVPGVFIKCTYNHMYMTAKIYNFNNTLESLYPDCVKLWLELWISKLSKHPCKTRIKKSTTANKFGIEHIRVC